MTNHLGNTIEDLAVVHLQCHADAERLEYTLHDLHKLHLTQERLRADDIDIALVELAIATLLRTVGTPYGLHLVTLEGECNLVLVLHNVAGKRHREVVAQTLLRDLRGLTHLLIREVSSVVARIQDLEEQFVALVAILTQEGREVLHRGGLERSKTIEAEDRLDRIENIVTTHHLNGREVARTLWNRRFLSHND